MSWTVACFCGTVFNAPPDRCPGCASQLPGAHSADRVDGAARPPGAHSIDRVDGAPQPPSVMALRDASATPTDFGSLERELSELIAST